MTEAQARARLSNMVASSSEPTLSTGEVDDLLALARRSDRDENPAYPTWQASTAYGPGDLVVPNPRNGHVYKATTAGTTAAAAPTWPTTSGATVADSGVTWQEAGADPWRPTWDLNAGAAEGWRWKAGKVAADFNFATDAQRFDRAQKHAACLKQAAEYASKVIESVATSRFPADHWGSVRA